MVWMPFSKLGSRRAVLNDLSPAATFIAYNYNTPSDLETFEIESKRILREISVEYGWMYETLHTDGKTKARINYTVWCEAFSCPECADEIVFAEHAYDEDTKKVKDEFPCPSCGVDLNKNRLILLYEALFDPAIRTTTKTPKRVPVLINYSIGKSKYEKKPDTAGLSNYWQSN